MDGNGLESSESKGLQICQQQHVNLKKLILV